MIESDRRSKAFSGVVVEMRGGQERGALAVMITAFAARPNCFAAIALRECGVEPSALANAIGYDETDAEAVISEAFRLVFTTAADRKVLKPASSNDLRLQASTAHLLQASLRMGAMQEALEVLGQSPMEVYANANRVSEEQRSEDPGVGEVERPRAKPYTSEIAELGVFVRALSERGGVAEQFAKEVSSRSREAVLSANAMPFDSVHQKEAYLAGELRELLRHVRERSADLGVEP